MGAEKPTLIPEKSPDDAKKRLGELKLEIGTFTFQEAKKETEKLLTPFQIEEARINLRRIGYTKNLGENGYTKELQKAYQDFQTRFGLRYPEIRDKAVDNTGNSIPGFASYHGIIGLYGLSLLKKEAESFDHTGWPKYNFLDNYKKIPSKKILPHIQVIASTIFQPQVEHIRILKSLFPLYDSSPIPVYIFAQTKNENDRGIQKGFHKSKLIFGISIKSDGMPGTKDSIFINKDAIVSGDNLEHVLLNESVHYLGLLYPDSVNNERVLQKTLSIHGKIISLPKNFQEIKEFESDIASACISWNSFMVVYRRLQYWHNRLMELKKEYSTHIPNYAFSCRVFAELGWLLSKKFGNKPPKSHKEELLWMDYIKKTLLKLHSELMYGNSPIVSIE